MTNSILEALITIGISDNHTIQPYYPAVRDRNDISVLKCKKSGVILLSQTDHISLEYYDNKDGLQGTEELTRPEALAINYVDDKRRADQLKQSILQSDWLDVGSGLGGVLDLLKPFAKSICAVEAQENARNELKYAGYSTVATIDEINNRTFDIITLFHVFEHIANPLETLSKARELLRPGGKLVIEVPHANDFLIAFLDLEEFKRFTFWSEHLILHTRNSLSSMLKYAGFENIVIQGVQRYPLANHLHWLAYKKPGGHKKWEFLSNPELDSAYEKTMQSLNMTDTLFAIAER